MKVENMTSTKSYAKIANQFIITADYDDGGESGKYFQSYQSMIAFRAAGTGTVTLDKNKWDYSRTTGKYRNQFLGETKKETEKKIKSGEYILADLN